MKLPRPKIIFLAVLAAFCPTLTVGHSAEQGFVLLLPTDFYMSSGIATVILTAILLGIIPASLTRKLFKTWQVPWITLPSGLHQFTSLCSLVVLTALVWIGLVGSGDPLSNPLPLIIWTFWWAMLLFLQGIIGDIWKWINPWTGIHQLLWGSGSAKILKLPNWIGKWLSIIGFILFSVFALADLAPDYPPRLASFVACYWIYTFVFMCVFGRDEWLYRGECFTILFNLFSKIAPLSFQSGNIQVGILGWQLARNSYSSLAIFSLTTLAVGSFDGFNETFWWLARIGINPLEFPGRSAVAFQTIGGMFGAVILLHIVFAFCVWLGHHLTSATESKSVTTYYAAFFRFALSVLPIALGYHFAHYLPSFLVNSQYLLAAISDPLTENADFLGLGVFYVTTGFFNTQETVRIILLTQCVAIVAGHVVAVMIAHVIALDIYESNRKAILSQIPMAVFMALYTFLSLWLLASPRGV